VNLPSPNGRVIEEWAEGHMNERVIEEWAEGHVNVSEKITFIVLSIPLCVFFFVHFSFCSNQMKDFCFSLSFPSMIA
jgi:hypothetical protein